jgi:hypothetical protein
MLVTFQHFSLYCTYMRSVDEHQRSTHLCLQCYVIGEEPTLWSRCTNQAANRLSQTHYYSVQGCFPYLTSPNFKASGTRFLSLLDLALKTLPRSHDVDMHATYLVGINGITGVLLVYTCQQVYTLEATYYPFDNTIILLKIVLHCRILQITSYYRTRFLIF